MRLIDEIVKALPLAQIICKTLGEPQRILIGIKADGVDRFMQHGIGIVDGHDPRAVFGGGHPTLQGDIIFQIYREIEILFIPLDGADVFLQPRHGNRIVVEHTVDQRDLVIDMHKTVGRPVQADDILIIGIGIAGHTREKPFGIGIVAVGQLGRDGFQKGILIFDPSVKIKERLVAVVLHDIAEEEGGHGFGGLGIVGEPVIVKRQHSIAVFGKIRGGIKIPLCVVQIIVQTDLEPFLMARRDLGEIRRRERCCRLDCCPACCLLGSGRGQRTLCGGNVRCGRLTPVCRFPRASAEQACGKTKYHG